MSVATINKQKKIGDGNRLGMRVHYNHIWGLSGDGRLCSNGAHAMLNWAHIALKLPDYELHYLGTVHLFGEQVYYLTIIKEGLFW